MEYTKLGRSGLEVSRLCLGCMSFGERGRWIHDWVLPEAASRALIRQALDLGINFFDTADVYSQGTSEQFLGRALRDFASRSEVVIATKVFFPMGEGRNRSGLSRKHILSAIDGSLQRLGTDYVDLYIIHRFDHHTPVEETMEALSDVVKMGKARYLGASAMYAWQFQKMRNAASRHGLHNFISMQNHWNLLYREDEREMVPYCQDAGVALTPYSPLASGRLSRRQEDAPTLRLKTDSTAKSKYDATAQMDSLIVRRVEELSEKRGMSMSQVALAWLLHQQMLAAPVIGATKAHHLADAARAVDMKLSPGELAWLAEPYQPHPVVGAL